MASSPLVLYCVCVVIDPGKEGCYWQSKRGDPMEETKVKDQRNQNWPEDSMELDEHLEPDAKPAGVRRNQQDTQPVDGDAAINQPQDGQLGIRQPIQG